MLGLMCKRLLAIYICDLSEHCLCWVIQLIMQGFDLADEIKSCEPVRHKVDILVGFGRSKQGFNFSNKARIVTHDAMTFWYNTTEQQRYITKRRMECDTQKYEIG
jgi:hypothetical protein